MGIFRVSPFCAAFAALLNHPNSEIMLLSARAVTHLLEALPNSAQQIVSSGIVTSLVEVLLSIQYIDVAEQSLQV
jgi:hypothetical protein